MNYKKQIKEEFTKLGLKPASVKLYSIKLNKLFNIIYKLSLFLLELMIIIISSRSTIVNCKYNLNKNIQNKMSF